MRNHLIQYHNVAEMGPLKSATRGRDPEFQVVSRKSSRNVLGSVIWLIVGKGSPRKYSLAFVFEVGSAGQIEAAEDNDFFQYYCRGTVGFAFRPPVALNDLDWFDDLLAHQSSFSFGLNPLDPYHVQSLLSLTRSYDAFIEALWADYVEARTIRSLNRQTNRLEGTFRPLEGRKRNRRGG